MEWWWLQSDSLADISESLVRDGYAVVDGFLLPSEARDLRIEVDINIQRGRWISCFSATRFSKRMPQAFSLRLVKREEVDPGRAQLTKISL
mmetsp:Transcript_2868/g.4365  ORF Transcript_2868/g.4365 Transcript_2868/m.4365 type:complete len:91 (-) Transcript_2868:886-1158(-)